MLRFSECKIFAENKVKVKIKANQSNNFYTVIAPIRMMALKALGESKEDYHGPILNLPDHATDRQNCAKSEWNMIEMEVVAFLRERCFMKNEVSEEELHKYAGIFMVNGVTVGNAKGAIYGKALYATFSVMNHDCLGNAKYKIDPDTWEVKVKAHTPIKKGQEITIQYFSSILGTHKRRKRIKGENVNKSVPPRLSFPKQANQRQVSVFFITTTTNQYSFNFS